MAFKIPILLVAISCLIILSLSQQSYIYTIRHARSFRRDLLEKYMGCQSNLSSISYGTFIYPTGIKDALFVYYNQGTYQTRLSCNWKEIYITLFGRDQNYAELLRNDAASVAQRIKQTTNRGSISYIVDWKIDLTHETEKAMIWLDRFVETLNGNGNVYVKAPASYFCYTAPHGKYLMDLRKANKFIVEMYGEEAGIYTSYEEMFEKQGNKPISNPQKYSADCPKFPSYQTLKKNSTKQFFIEKTLQKEEAGYIGPKFGQYLEQAKSLYGKAAFFDSFPQQIIQL